MIWHIFRNIISKSKIMKLIVTLFLSLFIFSASAQDDPTQAVGNWSGSLNLPGGQSLKIVFHVTSNKGALSATMDSPDQQAYDLKMDKVTYSDSTIEMSMNQIQGVYTGRLKEGKFEGTWSQAGQEFPLTLERVVKKAKK